MFLAAARARESLANARSVPRNILRGNWSSATTRASDARGVVCHDPRSPRAARSQMARKRRRISESNGSDFWNHDLRGRPRSRESGAPNQKSSTSMKSGALTKELVADDFEWPRQKTQLQSRKLAKAISIAGLT